MANRRFATRARKRVMSWQGGVVDFSDLVAATSQFSTLVSETSLENFPTPTVIRTRGRLMLTGDASSSAGSRGFVVCGIMVVTATALAASAVPSPFLEVGSDWLWWDVLTFGDVTGSVSDDGPMFTDRIVVDSKAMRKIGLNEVLVFAAHLQSCQSTTMVGNLCGDIRVLLKAP